MDSYHMEKRKKTLIKYIFRSWVRNWNFLHFFKKTKIKYQFHLLKNYWIDFQRVEWMDHMLVWKVTNFSKILIGMNYMKELLTLHTYLLLLHFKLQTLRYKYKPKPLDCLDLGINNMKVMVSGWNWPNWLRALIK